MKTVHWLPSTVSSAFSPVRLHGGSLTTGTTRQPPDGDPLPNTLACGNVWKSGPVAHRRQAGDTVVHASASQPPRQKPGPHEVGQTPSSLLYRGSISHHGAGPQGRGCWGQGEVCANLAASLLPAIFAPTQALAAQLPDCTPFPGPQNCLNTLRTSAPFPPNAASLLGPTFPPPKSLFSPLPAPSLPRDSSSPSLPSQHPSPVLIAGIRVLPSPWPALYPSPSELLPGHGLSPLLCPAGPVWPMGPEHLKDRELLKSNLDPLRTSDLRLAWASPCTTLVICFPLPALPFPGPDPFNTSPQHLPPSCTQGLSEY
ncbi:vegetative cell wall protein gp1-like [Felis catus]|uniref:vegetative cell wall protein gp1-like n=1 Tax=Felis catus TaxID=9685 RepID=UPI001D19E746|nr:vegetative cell wall protein gp1-like [Felis catus]